MQQNAGPPFPAGTQECSFDSKHCSLLAAPGAALILAWPCRSRHLCNLLARPGKIQTHFYLLFQQFCLPAVHVLPPPALPHLTNTPVLSKGHQEPAGFLQHIAEIPQSHRSPLPGRNSHAAPEVLVTNGDKREQNSERRAPANAGSTLMSCLFILQGFRSGFHYWD